MREFIQNQLTWQAGLGSLMWSMILTACFRLLMKVFGTKPKLGRLYWFAMPLCLMLIFAILSSIAGPQTPSFVGRISQMITAEYQYANVPNPTTAFVPICTLINRGAPSIVNGWVLEIKVPGQKTNLLLPPSTVPGPISAGPITYGPSSQLYEKLSEKPLEKGAAVNGIVIFLAKGWKREQFPPNTEMFLHFRDYTDREYTLQYGLGIPETPLYFPGATGVNPNFVPNPPSR